MIATAAMREEKQSFRHPQVLNAGGRGSGDVCKATWPLAVARRIHSMDGSAMTKPRKVLLAALLALLAGSHVGADAGCATTSHHRQNHLVRLRGHPNS
jgi:hypothetical protein